MRLARSGAGRWSVHYGSASAEIGISCRSVYESSVIYGRGVGCSWTRGRIGCRFGDGSRRRSDYSFVIIYIRSVNLSRSRIGDSVVVDFRWCRCRRVWLYLVVSRAWVGEVAASAFVWPSVVGRSAGHWPRDVSVEVLVVAHLFLVVSTSVAHLVWTWTVVVVVVSVVVVGVEPIGVGVVRPVDRTIEILHAYEAVVL